MSTEQSEVATSEAVSPFWPLVLMGGSLLVLLVSMLYGQIRQYSGASAEIAKREQAIQQTGGEVQKNLTILASGLLDLSRYDGEARAIVAKYEKMGIRFAPPAPAASGSAPAALPAPAPAPAKK